MASVGSQHKAQLALLMKTLESTSPNFVRCIKPNYQKEAGKFKLDLVLEQLRCNGVVEGIKISQRGYPSRVLFDDFTRRWVY